MYKNGPKNGTTLGNIIHSLNEEEKNDNSRKCKNAYQVVLSMERMLKITIKFLIPWGVSMVSSQLLDVPNIWL